jgi:mono/diheme cytochrome c family protein
VSARRTAASAGAFPLNFAMGPSPAIRRLLPALAALLLAATARAQGVGDPTTGAGDPNAGAYVFLATGGCGCHTERKHQRRDLGGGRAIKTPFGTIYGPNITPDRQTGIGAWSEADFVRAMSEGIGPKGDDLYPVFPYPAFTRMTEADLGNLWSYLRTLEPVRRANKAPDLMAPFNVRQGVKAWKLLHFTPGRYQPDRARSPAWNRGAYLVTALAHCGECHTPRDLSGGLRTDMAYAGSTDGPEGEAAPNITPDKETGIGEWDPEDIVYYLRAGRRPDGHAAEGLMDDLIENAYGKLKKEDLFAIVTYLRALPPIRHKVSKRDAGKTR